MLTISIKAEKPEQIDRSWDGCSAFSKGVIIMSSVSNELDTSMW